MILLFVSSLLSMKNIDKWALDRLLPYCSLQRPHAWRLLKDRFSETSEMFYSIFWSSTCETRYRSCPAFRQNTSTGTVMMYFFLDSRRRAISIFNKINLIHISMGFPSTLWETSKYYRVDKESFLARYNDIRHSFISLQPSIHGFQLIPQIKLRPQRNVSGP